MAYDERLEGELIGFTYQVEDGGFAVARLRDEGGHEIPIVGPIAHVAEGQHLALVGRWTEHAQYGRQFRVRTLLAEDPRTRLGLERYLASGAVRGLGPTYAKRVVATFGLDTLRVIQEQPERLLEVPGIGPKRLAEITAHWERDQGSREAQATLRGFGVGQALANRIIEKYGDDALSVVQRQPYRMAAEVRGVGFRTADAIARSVGIAADDPARAEAALVFSVDEAEKAGHCFLPEDELLTRVDKLDVPSPAAVEALGRLTGQGLLVRHGQIQPAPVYSPALERAEATVARRLRTLAGTRLPGASVDLAAIEGGLGITLNGQQRRAVSLALDAAVTVITGGPGTGKTTIVRALLQAARGRGERWLLAAPTGRAAKRLAEATGAEGRTIHRLLEFNGRTNAFTRDASNPLDAEGVLVDEASMMDLRLTHSLLAALPPGCRLVLVGDADQLPSVGAGRVLADVIASGVIAVSTLTEVYRQAAGSGIVRNAHRINRGQDPVSGQQEQGTADFFLLPRADALEAQATLLEVVARRLTRQGYDPRADVQVLTPMHNGPLGTGALNQRLQAVLNPTGHELKRGDTVFRVGDRVLQLKNDYDNEVFNGDTGRIVEATPQGLVVDFDDKAVAIQGEKLGNIDLAYAISIHKSQGSEYPAVVIVLHRAHHVMLRRNLIYTAITRARRFCCVIGDSWALDKAVATSGGDRRWTRLADRLRE